MLKNGLYLLFIIAFILSSCRNNDSDTLQNIDQVLEIYIDSAGTDMLNTRLKNAYTSFSVNDINGATDNSPVNTFTLKKNADTLNYIEYVSGAVRVMIDSSSPTDKYYRSDFAINFVKKINDSTGRITNDTLSLKYHFTPYLFSLVSAEYRTYGKKFNLVKSSGHNILKISK